MSRRRRGGQWGDGFRDRLRKAMAKARLNQNQLAERLDCGSGMVTVWLSRGLPGADYLNKIAQACDVSADWLLGADVPMEPTRDVALGAGVTITEQQLDQALRRLVARELRGVEHGSDAARTYAQMLKVDPKALRKSLRAYNARNPAAHEHMLQQPIDDAARTLTRTVLTGILTLRRHAAHVDAERTVSRALGPDAGRLAALGARLAERFDAQARGQITARQRQQYQAHAFTLYRAQSKPAGAAPASRKRPR